ncbi:hypothetical protein Moror_13372, partial [Moniliophthora roreri MCA 2997]
HHQILPLRRIIIRPVAPSGLIIIILYTVASTHAPRLWPCWLKSDYGNCPTASFEPEPSRQLMSRLPP